jgi:hypothetical protein
MVSDRMMQLKQTFPKITVYEASLNVRYILQSSKIPCRTLILSENMAMR